MGHIFSIIFYIGNRYFFLNCFHTFYFMPLAGSCASARSGHTEASRSRQRLYNVLFPVIIVGVTLNPQDRYAGLKITDARRSDSEYNFTWYLN